MTELDPVADDVPERPEIRSSWRRTSDLGLAPDTPVDPEDVAPFDESSRLRRAAAPVLDELAAALDGSRYTLILADEDAVLVDIRYGRDVLRPALDGVGAVVGRRFTEATTGTNSIATALELRRGIAVRGAEHYLESFRRFACYGLPVTDPATRRGAGVLDITCLQEDTNALLRPFLLRGVRDIESRLLGDTRRAHRRVLDAFDAAALTTSDALVGLSADLVLTNDAAAELLEPADHAALQVMALEMAGMRRRAWHSALDLVAGGRVGVEGAAVEGGVLVRLHRARRGGPIRRRREVAGDDWHAALGELTTLRSAGTSVLVRGEPGTGRRTVARRLAGPGVVELDGSSATAADVHAVPAGSEVVLVADVQLLDAVAAALLDRRADENGLRLVLTATAGAPPVHVAGVVGRCPVHLDLPTLRSRRDRIPSLAAAMLRTRSPALRFTPRALRALASQAWPGNLAELGTVVDHVAAARSAGDLTEADLPAGYRILRPTASTPLVEAERDTIIEALRLCDGNKVHAAVRLGISRTTLYKRIRTLHIDVDVVRGVHAVDR